LIPQIGLRIYQRHKSV